MLPLRMIWAPSVTEHSFALAFASQNEAGLDFWIFAKGDIPERED